MCLPRSRSISRYKIKGSVGWGGLKAHLSGVCKQWVTAEWNGPAVIKRGAENCSVPAGYHKIKK